WEALRRAGTHLAFLERARQDAGALADSAAKAHTALLEAAEGVDREIGDIEDRTARLRLVAADTLFAPLARAVRDAAELVGREVSFETGGGDIRLDAHVLAGVREALLHVVRNAVAHGIEAPSDRVAAGKPAAG